MCHDRCLDGKLRIWNNQKFLKQKRVKFLFIHEKIKPNCSALNNKHIKARQKRNPQEKNDFALLSNVFSKWPPTFYNK